MVYIKNCKIWHGARGVYFSTIRAQSVWKTNNRIVEGKYSMSKIYVVFEYFYMVEYIAISFHINSCGRVFNIRYIMEFLQGYFCHQPEVLLR